MIALPSARSEPRLLPVDRHEAYGEVEPQIERSEGHHREWYDACIEDKPFDHPKCNFAYAGPMSETILLGNVALRMNRRLEWDSENMCVTNVPEANQYINKEYRAGWKF